MLDTSKRSQKQTNLFRAFAWAGVLVFVDAFYLNQGVISAVVGLWMLFVSLPLAAMGKDVEEKRRRLARVAIYVGAVALVFGFNWANNALAKRRFEMLISAIKAYKREHQRYPAKLDELVPAYLDRVPSAKYTIALSEFYYIVAPGDHSLFYVELPPFGRPGYTFEKDRRWYLD